ncbi:MAG: AEC family transporter [Candidatus Faecousia sp.]|nr:AEC family transporter [Candidatus Faecousia sp.]
MSIVPVIKQMITLSLLMLTGFFANRFGILGRDAQKWMSKLIINITCPALILSSVTTSQRLENNQMVLIIFGAAIAYYLILPFLAKGCALAGPRNRRSEYTCMLIYSNLGFMGIPVANAVLGKEAILYISIFMAIFNISIFSYGIILLGGTGGGKLQFKKMINPGTVSAVAAVLLYLGSISIPTLLLEPITAMGNTTTPLAMMVIGASLANGKVRDLFTEKSMILFTVLRLLGLPLLAWVVCQILGVQDRLLAGALILISGMPVASNTVMLCTELNRDGDYIAKGLLISTLASVVTIPLISMLL